MEETMKIINLDLNSAVLRGTKQDAIKCLKECFEVLEASKKMADSLRDWNPESGESQEEHTAMQLINAEILLEKLNTPAIDLYHDGSLSKFPALFDRLEVFQGIKEQLLPILDTIVDAYIDLTEEEKIAVQQLSEKILEQLSFFVFYEFNFNETSYSLKNNQELEVNEVVLDYLGKEGLKLEKKLIFILDIFIHYRPTIPSFDFSDEEIDMFYYYVGVLAHTILDNIDEIEPEIVRKLAHGEIEPEDVIAKLYSSGEVKQLDLFN
jgi:hypothetical protein